MQVAYRYELDTNLVEIQVIFNPMYVVFFHEILSPKSELFYKTLTANVTSTLSLFGGHIHFIALKYSINLRNLTNSFFEFL